MAQAILEKGVAKNPGPWREHSIAVAEAAEKIARAGNEKAGTVLMNPDRAYICGLLHDIGRQEGHTYIAHVYDGYHFLKSLGFDFAAKIRCFALSLQSQKMVIFSMINHHWLVKLNTSNSIFFLLLL